MKTLPAAFCICILLSTARAQIVVEPDNYTNHAVLNHVVAEVSLITAASNNLPHQPVPFDIVAATNTAPFASPTGSKVFAHAGGIPFFYTDRRFRMDFNGLVSDISIDFQGGEALVAEQGTLIAFDSNGSLLDSFTTAPLLGGMIQTMSIDRPTPDIAWAVAYTITPSGGFGRLDHLSFSPPVAVPEPGIFALGGTVLALLIFGRRTIVR